nr:transforming growth factor-beta receptor-associated protein 1-like [Lytechinus pictus]
MDHVRPNLHKSVQKQQSAIKRAADKRSEMRQFKLNDTVLVKNFAAGPTWLRGIVTETLNEVKYVMELQDGREVRRHVDHIRLYTLSHGNYHDKEEMPDQNTNLQPEILIQQTQYPSLTTENPNMAPSTSESLISNTEQSNADTTATSQQVQTESLCDSDGAVMPNMPNSKVQALLADKRVEEALNLAKNYRKAGLGKDKFMQMYNRIQQQAGFIQFAQLNFADSMELFKEAKLDVRELICLYPNLLPSNSNFHRAIPPLHDFADISQVVRGKPDKATECKQFLMDFLEDVRETDLAVGMKLEVDTALMKLYAESNPSKLITLISSENSVDPEDSGDYLHRFGRHHALALLHKYQGDSEQAMVIWSRLVDGDIADETFPGLGYVIDFLSSLSDHELVWRYVDWVMRKEPENATKIFTDRPENEPVSERMRPDVIIDYLHAYPTAVIRYLEHLVFVKKMEKEKYHTHLAVLYLDQVLKMKASPDTVPRLDLDLARSKLRHLLQDSSIYRVQLILGKVKETDMYAECAILYGKLEEHDKALRILVHKLQDYGAAENYCVVNSKDQDQAYRRRLFQLLLTVYLDPMEGKKDSLLAPAMNLLNSPDADFDTVRVLQLLPETWSVGLISRFLSEAIRSSTHGSRMSRVEHTLTRSENLHLRSEIVHNSRCLIPMNEDQTCQVCQRPFSEPTFVRYPNGVITHTQCARNKAVCPVTGRLFSTRKEST